MKAAQKKKRDLAISIVLVLVFAFTFTKNVLLRKKGVPASGGAPVAASDANPTLSASNQLVYITRLKVMEDRRKAQEAVWKTDWGRDPFVPLALSAVIKAVNLTLQGVLWDEASPKAIVNDKTLVVGDEIYGYVVEAIRPRSVLLRTGKKTIELAVFHPVSNDSA